MATEVLKQTKSIRLDSSDWIALAEIAKAHNRSVNNYIETIVKTAIAVGRREGVLEDDTLMSEEVYFAKIDAAFERVEAGHYIELKPEDDLQGFLDSL